MRFLDWFRRRPPIRDASALADFIDRQAAFLMQKGIYEYARARAGHYAKVLFAEPGFQAAVEQSRWRAYPLGLAMVGELVEGVLRPYGTDRHRQLDALSSIVLAVFDRYPVPAALGAQSWSEARDELARRLRADPTMKHAVLVALTGYGDLDEREPLMAGFDHHLAKPVEPAALTAAIRMRVPASPRM